MKKLLLMLLTIASTNVIVAMQPHQESVHERFLRLTVQPAQQVTQETQTPVPYRITLPRVQFMTQPRTNDELGGIQHATRAIVPTRTARTTLPAAMVRNMNNFRIQPTANSMHVQSNDSSSLYSYSSSDSSSSDDSFLSVSSHASQATENRENNHAHDYVFSAVDTFNNDDTAQVARFLVQIRGIPTRLAGAHHQDNQ